MSLSPEQKKYSCQLYWKNEIDVLRFQLIKDDKKYQLDTDSLL